MTENNQSTVESGLSTLFGYYPERFDISTTQFTLQTHSDFQTGSGQTGLAGHQPTLPPRQQKVGASHPHIRVTVILEIHPG